MLYKRLPHKANAVQCGGVSVKGLLRGETTTEDWRAAKRGYEQNSYNQRFSHRTRLSDIRGGLRGTGDTTISVKSLGGEVKGKSKDKLFNTCSYFLTPLYTFDHVIQIVRQIGSTIGSIMMFILSTLLISSPKPQFNLLAKQRNTTPANHHKTPSPSP